jgi:hypothetical protein
MSATGLVIQLLLQDSDVAALVDEAVFPIIAPTDVSLPYITVRVIAEDAEYVLGGDTGAFDARIEVACHHRNFAKVDALGEAVKGALICNIETEVKDAKDKALGTITTWKAGADISDVTEDRKIFRRLMDFRGRWH